MAEDSKMMLLNKIRQYNFAAYDMLLYLDTHPEDKKAFSIYRELKKKCQKLIDDYHAKYGPLTIDAIAEQCEFNWHLSPWPWETTANEGLACSTKCDEEGCK